MTNALIKNTGSSSSASTYLMVPIFIFFVLLIFAVIRGPSLISSAGIGSAIIVVAPLVLATYALTIMAMAGRATVDLSIGPLIGFINVSLIQLVGIGFLESIWGLFIFAIAAGIAYQLLMSLIIVYVRVQPIIVALSGYLTLVGLNLIIMQRPGGVATEWMLSWGAGTEIFSPVLVILVLATAGWYLLAKTAFFGNLKMMGSDERATYTSGVNINLVRIGAHVVGGIYAGLAAITFTSLISSGDPSQGTTYTLMAVTALVLGGANLAGGRGSAFGALLGALNIYLITFVLSTFNFGMVQSYVTDLAYGVILVVSLLISIAIPELQRRVKNLSPMMFFVICATLALGVVVHVALDQFVDPLNPKPRFNFASSSTEVDDGTGYSGGTYFMFIILGLVVTSYIVRLLFSKNTPSMTALVVLLTIVALGLIFSPEVGLDTVVADMTLQAKLVVNTSVSATEFFALEATPKSAISMGFSTIVMGSLTLLAAAAAILLASLVILLAMPHVAMGTKRLGMILFWCVSVIVGIAVLFGQSSEVGYLQSTMPGETYGVLILVAMLFVITAPMVQTKVHNVTNLFIGVCAILALIAVYFFASSQTGSNLDIGVYGEPILGTVLDSVAIPQVIYAEPTRIMDEGSSVAVFAQLAYGAIIVVLAHIVIRLAMGGVSFKRFWRYWYVPVWGAFLWGGLFYSSGVDLWKIILVVGIAILSAPNVMHIISTYMIGEHKDDAIRQWSNERG
ncbi:ABC transporter permease [Candidatus Njordibacter sp. Uisw_039]|jgi:ribose transport system permease protein|uniref:ABC transporter permease n=1 Tax=Candidatus Njordibacter sp. Uisw_039 TaxID=3230972 RepID=UPI003D42136F|tara:strand:- start:2239 stop:4443 length:2205 start_codon:yes stop_codon:yes gene_type:complete